MVPNQEIYSLICVTESQCIYYIYPQKIELLLYYMYILNIYFTKYDRKKKLLLF